MNIRNCVLGCVFLAALGAASVAPFFFAAGGGMAQAHDITIHWMRMIKFDEVLRSGVWFPRWLGGMNDGYGVATMIYYPPLFYYLAAGAHAVLGGWVASLAAVAMLTASASGLCFYFYVRLFIDRTPALVASAAYLLLPYHLIDLYHRGAFPELIAFVWMPLVMYGFTKAVWRTTGSSIVLSGAAFALLIVTHPPMAYLFSICLAVYAAAWSGAAKNLKPGLIAVTVGALGAGLAAFYAVPAVLETGYARQTVTEQFKYPESYIASLLSSGGFFGMLGVAAVVTASLLIVFAMMGPPENSSGRVAWTGWVLAGAFALLLMTPACAVLTRFLPRFESIAFSWRSLAILTMAVSVLAGTALQRVTEDGRRARARIVFGMAAGAVVFSVAASAAASNLRVAFDPPARYVEEEFLPISDSKTAAAIPIETMGGATARASMLEWKPQERLISTRSSEQFILNVATYDFPGWTARIDGEPAGLRRNENAGVISIEAPAGEHVLRLTFENTPVRRRAAQISMVSVVVCAVLLAGSFWPAARALFGRRNWRSGGIVA